MGYVIIAILGVCLLCIGGVIGAAISDPPPPMFYTSPALVAVEEVPEEGTAVLIVRAPDHVHPITCALIYDGDKLRKFKEDFEI